MQHLYTGSRFVPSSSCFKSSKLFCSQIPYFINPSSCKSSHVQMCQQSMFDSLWCHQHSILRLLNLVIKTKDIANTIEMHLRPVQHEIKAPGKFMKLKLTWQDKSWMESKASRETRLGFGDFFFCYYANFCHDHRYETVPTISKMQFHLAALEFHRVVSFPCSLSILALQQYCWSLLVSCGCAA